MTIRITTSARSNFGQVLALTLIAVPLVVFGMYLATGDLQAGDTLRMQSVIKGMFSAKWLQQKGVSLSTALGDHFKKYGRVELLAYYGAAILGAFLVQGLVGRFIRSYRFEFQRQGKQLVRREMWLYARVWALAWVVAGGLLALVIGGWRGVAWGVAVPGVVMVPVWWWRREWLMRELYVPGLRRRVGLERIKRMEVVAGAEGAGLVVTFGDERAWTVARGSPGRMQRVGAAAGRVAGLVRRDVVTWGR